MNQSKRGKLLVVTVNDYETDAFKALSSGGIIFSAFGQESHIAYDINKYNIASYKQYEIVHFKQSGQQGSNASQEQITNAIDYCNPDAVIMLGIGWGNGAPQIIGDIMVSQAIVDTNHRVDSEEKGLILDSNAHFPAGRVLFSAIETSIDAWKKSNTTAIHFGPMISDNSFLSNKILKSKLLSLVPYSIGGEMEAAGAVLACRSRDINELIIIKAISDWGDGTPKKNEDTKKAAENAANLLQFLLERDALKRLPLKNVGSTATPVNSSSVENEKDGVIAEESLLNQAYLLSTQIKNNALRMIDLKDTHSHTIPLMPLLKDFRQLKATQRWQAAQQLFDMASSITDVSDVRNKHRIQNPSEIFSWLREKVTDSRKTIPAILKGSPKLGKSSVMGLFYVYLLDKYTHEDFSYLPFYFNAGATLKNESGIDILNDISHFFADAENLCAKNGVQALFFIDGLTNSKVFDGTVEKVCWEKAKLFESSTAHHHKLIFAIDDYSEITNQLSDVGTRESVDYVIYINRVNTVNALTTDDRVKSFIYAYSLLFERDINARDRAYNNYQKLGLSYIDFNIISIVEYQLFSGSTNSITELYGAFFREKIPAVNERQAALINHAHNIMMDENIEFGSYSPYINKDDFKLVIEQYGLLQYLVARQYVMAIESQVYSDKVLDMLFDKQTSTFVLELLNSNQHKQKLTKTLEMLYEKVSCKGKSSISYLVSRMSSISNPAVILDKQQKILNEIKINLNYFDSPQEYDYFAVAQRSISISKIALKGASNSEVEDATFNYLHLLFDSSYNCMINRAFHRLYYGDITWKVFEAFHDSVGPGFDFRNSFHSLATKLQYAFDEGKRIPLLEVNLFTMCNLFQVRIEEPWAQIIKGKYRTEYEPTNFAKVRKTFLYEPQYQKYADFLNVITKWIDCYFQHFIIATDNLAYKALLSYLKMMKDIIQDYLNNRDNEQPKGAYRLYDTFDNLHKLFNVRRIGWNIPTNKPIDSQARNDILNKTKAYETTGEHVLSAYWIGMFFLPDNNSPEGLAADSDYNKQEILNAILLHDLGEATLGDYSPLCEDYSVIKGQEDEINSAMFSLGTFNRLGSTFKTYELWNKWSLADSGGDYNVQIAKDIDKVQMIYKLLAMRDINSDEPYFDAERFNNFLEAEQSIKTKVGQSIFHHLINDHPRYATYFKPLESPNPQKIDILKLEAITFNPKATEFIGKGYGRDYSDVTDSIFEIIRQNPRSMTIQTIDETNMILINLCKSTTKRQSIKFVKNAAVFHLSINSELPVVRIEFEDAYSIKSSADDCYELNNLEVSADCNGIESLKLSMQIAYAYSLDGDAPSLNCERLRELSKEPNCENVDIDILTSPDRAGDIISFSSTAYLYVVTVQTDEGERDIRYTFALARDEDGRLITNEQGYFFDATHFELLVAEQDHICGKAVSWKSQEEIANRNSK